MPKHGSRQRMRREHRNAERMRLQVEDAARTISNLRRRKVRTASAIHSNKVASREIKTHKANRADNNVSKRRRTKMVSNRGKVNRVSKDKTDNRVSKVSSQVNSRSNQVNRTSRGRTVSRDSTGNQTNSNSRENKRSGV